MARFALKHQQAGWIGKGNSVWSVVHTRDLSYGYLTILKWLESSPLVVSLDNPYFFCENGQEIEWKRIAAFIGQSLHAAGKIPDPVPRQIHEEEFGDLFGPYSMVVIGQNSRSRADRLRELGWEAKHLEVGKSFQEDELPVLLKETGDFSGYAKPAASGSG